MEVRYQDIERANYYVEPTEIKGKKYVEVNQRVTAFRRVYPTGFIKTEILSNENGVVIMRAICGYHDDDGEPIILSTGTAYEKENSTFINKTSFIENCETSAIGRCLGMAGFGIDTSIASYEEVATAIQNQNQESKDIPSKTPITQDAIAKIQTLYTSEEIQTMLNNLNVSDISKLKMSQANKMILARTGLNDQTETF